MLITCPFCSLAGSKENLRAMILYRWTWALLASVLLGTSHLSEAGGGSVSKGSDHKTDKSKIQMLQSYAPAQERDPDDEDKVRKLTPVDGSCPVGENFSGTCQVHPLVVAYMEEDEPGDGVYDIHAAVSLDEGQTWKRMNLSNNAKRQLTYHGRPCFTKEGEDDGDDGDCDGGEHRFLQDEAQADFTFRGDNFKPAIVAKGDKILVAWTSTNCKGGVPGNQGVVVEDGPYDYEGDGDNDEDPHNKLSISDNTDRFKVKGKQSCHDYSNELPDGGNTPFSCVWAARGKVEESGVITWTKPERITSGRRDATQLVAAVSGNEAGWALAWQEDAKGLRVGEAEGSGDGMSK